MHSDDTPDETEKDEPEGAEKQQGGGEISTDVLDALMQIAIAAGNEVDCDEPKLRDPGKRGEEDGQGK